MLTLLQMCQEVLNELGDWEVPDTIVGNANATAKQMLAAAQRENRELARRLDWTALMKEGSITLSEGTASYPKPSDHLKFLNNTAWDRTGYKPLGVADPQLWQAFKGSLAATTLNFWWRERGDLLLVYPAPASADEGTVLFYEYITNEFVSVNGSFGDKAHLWANDADEPRLPDDIIMAGLKWRFLKAKSLTYQPDLNDYESMVISALNRDGPKPVLHMADCRDSRRLDAPCITVTGTAGGSG